ncbi:hypothetical protein QAD02_008312 [Eretmocerus hayati]|uniref:Uncharacterized protein n=1 Tax=Eretmocerus hayati TaxID=131215 RepID=A0ACC2N638_9HYME|nr:hypothetical protein QAD02_008312 [Eretmocerus hayati]
MSATAFSSSILADDSCELCIWGVFELFPNPGLDNGKSELTELVRLFITDSSDFCIIDVVAKFAPISEDADVCTSAVRDVRGLEISSHCTEHCLICIRADAIVEDGVVDCEYPTESDGSSEEYSSNGKSDTPASLQSSSSLYHLAPSQV